MKAYEIMEDLFSLSGPLFSDRTCDTIKAGDPNAEVTKVAVSMFATVDIVRQAKDWGAELLIVHEPTYYNHWDDHSDDYFEAEKRRLIEASGLTIYRFHDHPHCTDPDIITTGEIQYLGLDCTLEKTDVFDLTRLHLNTPMTPRQLAKHIEWVWMSAVMTPTSPWRLPGTWTAMSSGSSPWMRSMPPAM